MKKYWIKIFKKKKKKKREINFIKPISIKKRKTISKIDKRNDFKFTLQQKLGLEKIKSIAAKKEKKSKNFLVGP